MNTEERRLYAEAEANNLRFDTLKMHRELIFVSRDRSNYIDKISSLLIDTLTMGKQVRACWKENASLKATQGEKGAVLQKDLAQKEIELAEKENKLKEDMKNMPMPPPSSEQMSLLFSEIKQRMGSFAINYVEFSLKNDIIWVSIPEPLMFEPSGKNVVGKGLAIIVKLSEILKEKSYLKGNIYVYTANIANDSPLFSENWNTSALRSAAIAQVFMRYGVFSNQIASIVRIEEEKKGKVEIAISAN